MNVMPSALIVRHNLVLSVLWYMLSTNYLLPVSGSVSLLDVDVGSVPAGDEVSVVCNPIRMGRWSELMVVCVCHSDEVIREANSDANDTSEELGSAFPWSFVGESVFRTAKLEMLT